MQGQRVPPGSRSPARGGGGGRAIRPTCWPRVWVLVLFAVAPLLPGYRGVRIPLAALVVALFAGCAWNTPPATVHQPMTARAAPPRDMTIPNTGAIYQPETAGWRCSPTTARAG